MGVMKDYDLGQQLGKGAQGVVFKAVRRADRLPCAVKQVFLRTMSHREQVSSFWF